MLRFEMLIERFPGFEGLRAGRVRVRAYESSIFCQMDRCHVVLENRMARSLDSSGKDLVTAMLLSEGAWEVLFSKKLVSFELDNSWSPHLL